jgi:general secretion pathway protein C
MKSGRTLPNMKGKKVHGLKMYGIRKISLWGKLGLHNGDVVLSANGMGINGPNKIHEAFASLQGTDVMELEILRHGKPMTMKLNIR